MSDWRIFGLQTSGQDVLVNIDLVREVMPVHVPEEFALESTLIMTDGSRIDCADYFDGVVVRLKYGDDAPETKKVMARLARDKNKHETELRRRASEYQAMMAKRRADGEVQS
jgi:hypothetical protein